jgi:hypothetical protein
MKSDTRLKKELTGYSSLSKIFKKLYYFMLNTLTDWIRMQ